MDYINLLNNYFVKYEDFFIKSKKQNSNCFELILNNKTYYLKNIELIEYLKDYCDLVLYFIKNENYFKNKIDKHSKKQNFTIKENKKSKICEFKGKNIINNSEEIFYFKGIIINDFLDFDSENKNVYKLTLSLKGIE